MTGTGSEPRFSVVVPAYNAAEFVEPCLKALLSAGFDASEITLVDDGSTDGTGEIAEGLGVRVLRHPKPYGAAQARNAAAGIADGTVLVFVDVDVAVHRDVRARLVEWFQGDDAPDAVFGSYDETPSRRELISRIRNLLHHHVHQENAGPIVSFWTGLGAVRREAFSACGGFDPAQSMMEDIELGLRLHGNGFRIVLDPMLQGTHRKYWSLKGMVRTDLWHRAVPWSRLLLASGRDGTSDVLNVSGEGRASVISVFVSLCALPLVAFAPLWGAVLIGAAIGSLAYANRRFLRRLHRLEGWTTGPAAIGVLWVHFLCAGLGYALVRSGLASD